MADDLENSGEWRDTVDARLSTLEARVDEEARLRAAMDEDLSGARAERKVLQALHDTQSEHTRQLREHGVQLREHGVQLKEHGAQLKEHGAQLKEHGAQLKEHGAQLKKLQEGVDELRTGQQKVLVGVELITRKLDSLIGDDS